MLLLLEALLDYCGHSIIVSFSFNVQLVPVSAEICCQQLITPDMDGYHASSWFSRHGFSIISCHSGIWSVYIAQICKDGRSRSKSYIALAIFTPNVKLTLSVPPVVDSVKQSVNVWSRIFTNGTMCNSFQNFQCFLLLGSYFMSTLRVKYAPKQIFFTPFLISLNSNNSTGIWC